MAQAIDFSYARPDPAAVKAAEIEGVLCYTGPARPDRDYIDACRAVGLTVCMVQESDPNRSQQGNAAGVADAQSADRRADEVGYPLTASICYVVSDGDASNPSTGAAQIAAYAAGIASVSRRQVFFYGNAYACAAALSGAPNALGSWIPSTWGHGSLLSQEANMASPLADTDLNTILAPYGAWGDSIPTQLEEDDVLYMHDKDGVHIWRMGESRRLVKDAEWKNAVFKYGNEHPGQVLTPFPFDQSWFDSLYERPVNNGDLVNIGAAAEQAVRRAVKPEYLIPVKS